MELLPAIANAAWMAASWREYRRFKRALISPEESQSMLLRRMLSRNAGSTFGQRHGFSRIQNYQDFTRQVPLVDYEHVEPWVGRIRQGETGVLTQESVRQLLPTSGSTGAGKLIPFTSGLQNDFN